jgi:hypothetical protein
MAIIDDYKAAAARRVQRQRESDAEIRTLGEQAEVAWADALFTRARQLPALTAVSDAVLQDASRAFARTIIDALNREASGE